MNDFLWGQGFRGLCADFGRPVVQHWTGLAFEHGPHGLDSTPATATTHLSTLCTQDPGASIAAAVEAHAAHAKTPGVFCSALAVDTRTWELLRYTLWREEPPADAGVRFGVGHLSRPGLAELPTGRQW